METTEPKHRIPCTRWQMDEYYEEKNGGAACGVKTLWADESHYGRMRANDALIQKSKWDTCTGPGNK
jgi:hypothetical protein